VRAARHLRGDIYEVRADAPTRSFRLLFSAEVVRSGLLSLSAFERTQKRAERDRGLPSPAFQTGADVARPAKALS